MFDPSRQSLIFRLATLRQHATALVVALVTLMPGALAADGLRLLMVERPGCYYCVVFKRDVAPIYEKSEEGRVAPLVHYDLRHTLPEGITLNTRAHVTPTFILLDANGQELDRLTGYPGDDFFWPYVSGMITRAIEDGADQPHS